jgi:hypothetical protein
MAGFQKIYTHRHLEIRNQLLPEITAPTFMKEGGVSTHRVGPDDTADTMGF